MMQTAIALTAKRQAPVPLSDWLAPASIAPARAVSGPPSRSAKRAPPRALGPQERNRVLGVLRTPRFLDLAPAEIYATLLDEGVYLCSLRTL